MSHDGSSARRRFHVLLAALMAIAAMAPASGSPVDFVFDDIGGQPHRLSDYRGKWVLVNYWATWCPPCLAELPELQRFHVEESERAVVLAVNVESIAADRLARFVTSLGLSFPVLRAGERPGREALLGPIDVLPTSYLVSPEGIVVARQSGPLTAEAVRGFVARYLKAQTRSKR
ncbi:MAG: TlpA family protein disulfide reductase [Burkholderiales bacterium]|nr:MAG: TlpA family protein disulfide reductase [Burkholderiales bacterium]